MRILVQRVFEGWVKVEGQTISHIKEGITVLVGLTAGDNKEVVEHMVNKTLNMRLWDKDGKSWAASVMDIKGQVLAVSQFTLYGTLKKGNKPDFHNAMQADEARDLFNIYVEMLKKKYLPEKIQTGKFQTLMEVGSVINGPVTIQHEKMADEFGTKKVVPPKEKKEEEKKVEKEEKNEEEVKTEPVSKDEKSQS